MDGQRLIVKKFIPVAKDLEDASSILQVKALCILKIASGQHQEAVERQALRMKTKKHIQDNNLRAVSNTKSMLIKKEKPIDGKDILVEKDKKKKEKLQVVKESIVKEKERQG